MKSKFAIIPPFLPLLLALLAFTPCSPAAITVPGADGSDGVLVIGESAPDTTVIDLSLAVTAAWDASYAIFNIYSMKTGLSRLFSKKIANRISCNALIINEQ